MTSIAPASASRIGNAYYNTEEELLYACAEAMREEYKAILDAGLGVDLVPILGDRRIVELQNEPGVEDRLVLLAHRLGASVEQLLLGVVIGIADPRGARRGDRGHEPL